MAGGELFSIPSVFRAHGLHHAVGQPHGGRASAGLVSRLPRLFFAAGPGLTHAEATLDDYVGTCSAPGSARLDIAVQLGAGARRPWTEMVPWCTRITSPDKVLALRAHKLERSYGKGAPGVVHQVLWQEIEAVTADDRLDG